MERNKPHEGGNRTDVTKAPAWEGGERRRSVSLNASSGYSKTKTNLSLSGHTHTHTHTHTRILNVTAAVRC